MNYTVLIIGAGPAGLTAAYNLLQRCRNDINVYIVEAGSNVGGISKTIHCDGFSYDLGGHRYFSNNPRIVRLWHEIMGNDLMNLTRSSKVYYQGKLINYPINLGRDTFSAVTKTEAVEILLSYFKSKLYPLKENSLKELYINRFGRKLYELFFKNYTEKVWGKSASQIPCDWGYERIGSVSISQLIKHAIVGEKSEPSTIRSFYYPKQGSGQLWNIVAQKIKSKNGQIILRDAVRTISLENGRIKTVTCESGRLFTPDYVFSSLALKDLCNCLTGIPENIKAIGDALPYRDMIIVGLVLPTESFLPSSILLKDGKLSRDQWIYVQDKTVKAGRIQIFNNWSVTMCQDNRSICLGLEYFCQEDSTLWNSTVSDWTKTVLQDLQQLKLIKPNQQISKLDFCKIPKAYPCYWGSYHCLNLFFEYIKTIQNLKLIGRNGLHRYINVDKVMELVIMEIDSLLSTR